MIKAIRGLMAPGDEAVVEPLLDHQITDHTANFRTRPGLRTISDLLTPNINLIVGLLRGDESLPTRKQH